MSLGLVQPLVCDALAKGAYSHVQRDDMEEKNWLSSGKVTREEVIDLLKSCAERDYTLSDHHQISRIKVHTFVVTKSVAGSPRWYLKFFFQPNNPGQGWKVYSVHPST